MIIESIALHKFFKRLTKHSYQIITNFVEHFENNKKDVPKDIEKDEFMLILMGIITLFIVIFGLYITIVVWIGSIRCIKNSSQGLGVKFAEIMFNFFPGVFVKWIVGLFTNSYCWLT